MMPNGDIDLGLAMAWHLTGDKRLPETMMMLVIDDIHMATQWGNPKIALLTHF